MPAPFKSGLSYALYTISRTLEGLLAPKRPVVSATGFIYSYSDRRCVTLASECIFSQGSEETNFLRISD